MKKSCKNINITSPNTILPWVTECVLRHKKRYDFRSLVCRAGYTRKAVSDALERQDDGLFRHAAVRIANDAATQIRARKLDITPITYSSRTDPSSGKVRMIGNECAMQQVFDYIAVRSCEEIWRRRIVPQQVSGIKGRGTLYGINIIKRWVDADNRAAEWAKVHRRRYSRKCKYHVKLDVKQCYPSLRVDVFMSRFRRDCANEDICWLWETLLASHAVDGYEGFMIGSLCSQWACQYIMSFLYRYAMSLHGREHTLISHMVIQMDDILLTGPNRKNLKSAAQKISEYAADELGLTIKANWQICALADTPIDIIGYRIHQSGRVSIRPRIFIRARRASLRGSRRSDLSTAQKIVSYKGYFVHSNSRRAEKRLHLQKSWSKAQHITSRHAQEVQHDGDGTILTNAGGHSLHGPA